MKLQNKSQWQLHLSQNKIIAQEEIFEGSAEVQAEFKGLVISLENPEEVPKTSSKKK